MERQLSILRGRNSRSNSSRPSVRNPPTGQCVGLDCIVSPFTSLVTSLAKRERGVVGFRGGVMTWLTVVTPATLVKFERQCRHDAPNLTPALFTSTVYGRRGPAGRSWPAPIMEG
ncbi:uncharacterized protein CTRU02_212998 [Colletotrichum truncatum]|uniref:Uncharacterized protein n=1 Tax=Colletotrichum truncatum TaxID=5467 RepID=A0ACC3YK06_COLTU|nr:uncharacterized protein CTRU02_03317 [Colletotrichum truncatum]KAF6797287.1 hypothetical protein CTRU02_03317 [Colletotrichum truncatum]